MNTNELVMSAASEARTKLIERNGIALSEASKAVRERALEVADLIRNNADHLDSFAVVMVAKHNDALVSTDGDATAGLSALAGTSRASVVVAKHCMEELIEENDGNPYKANRPSPDLDGVLARMLGRDR